MSAHILSLSRKKILFLSIFFSVFGFIGIANDVKAQPYGSGWCNPSGCTGTISVRNPGPRCTAGSGPATACPYPGLGCTVSDDIWVGDLACGQCLESRNGVYRWEGRASCNRPSGGVGGDEGNNWSEECHEGISPIISYSCNSTGTRATLAWRNGSTPNSIYALRIDDPTTPWTGRCPATRPDFCGDVSGSSRSFDTIPGRTYTVWIHAYDSCCGVFGCNPISVAEPTIISVSCSSPPPPAPTLTFTASGNGMTGGDIAIPNNTEATLTWTSSNATSCTASGSWSGPKVFNTTWSEGTGNLTTNPTGYIYTLRCDGAAGTNPVVASVRVRVTPPPPPLAVPVISHVCNAAGTWVTLNYGVPTATAYYLRIDEAEPSWNGSCTAPDRCINATPSPSYSGPVLPGVRYGSWVHAYRGSESKDSAYYTFQCNAPTLTVGVTATPASGIAPLNSTVTASVGGSATGTINYHFYCNGVNLTQSYLAQPATSLSHSHICSYPVAGTYTPRVRVERGSALPASGSATVIVGAPPVCTGSVPNLASLCSGDDSGLLANTPRTLVASCSVPAGSNPKCQYSCTPPATYNAGANRCELCGVCGSASDHCEGEYWADNCGNASVCGPGTKDCRQFWREVAP